MLEDHETDIRQRPGRNDVDRLRLRQQPLGEKVDRVLRLDGLRRHRQIGRALEAARAVGGAEHQGTGERAIAASRHRHVAGADELEDAQAVRCGLLDLGVAAGGGDAEKVDRGRAMRHHQRNRIVMAGIAIHQDRSSAHRHPFAPAGAGLLS